MERQIINGMGVLMGTIKDSLDKKFAYDRNGCMVGYYDKMADMTYDRNGSPKGKGDILAALIL